MLVKNIPKKPLKSSCKVDSNQGTKNPEVDSLLHMQTPPPTHTPSCDMSHEGRKKTRLGGLGLLWLSGKSLRKDANKLGQQRFLVGWTMYFRAGKHLESLRKCVEDNKGQ